MKKLLLAAAALATLAAPVKADPFFVNGRVVLCGYNSCDVMSHQQYRERNQKQMNLTTKIGHRDLLKGQQAQAVGDNAAACAAYYNAMILLAASPTAAEAFPQEAKGALRAGGESTCAGDPMKAGLFRNLLN